MSVQRVTITTYAPTLSGSVSRVTLVSQAVTGPQGTSGTGGDMMKADNLSGLSNYTTARSNLGLGTAATTAATAYATSAQGTKADSALQVGGSAVVGYVPTVTDDSPLAVEWTAPSGGGGGGANVSSLSLDGGTTRDGVIPGAVMVTSPTAGSTLGGSSSTAYSYFPVLVANDITIDALQMNVWSSGSGAAARLGLYEADDHWFPTNLVVDAGAIDCSSGGLKTASFAATALPAGRYLMVAQPNGAAAFTPLTLLCNMVGLFGFGLNAQQACTGLRTGNNTYGALPSTAFTTSIARTLGSYVFEYYMWMRTA